jgi:plasmid maintenance system killer protein
MNPIRLIETKDVLNYLEIRWLVKQYQKSKTYLQEWHSQKLDFKLRQPKEDGIYQFRINQKYRAFGVFRETEKYGKVLLVYHISDHQE